MKKIVSIFIPAVKDNGGIEVVYLTGDTSPELLKDIEEKNIMMGFPSTLCKVLVEKEGKGKYEDMYLQTLIEEKS